jgi:hypothetical protein
MIAAERDTWLQMFDTDEEAAGHEKEIQVSRNELAASLGMSLKAAVSQLQTGSKDLWLEISQADYKFLTASRDAAVASAYTAALSGAKPLTIDSARAQIEIYQELGARASRVDACLASFPPRTQTPALAQAIVFTGHMLDAPGRDKPRFPPSEEANARSAIKKAVSDLLVSIPGQAIGIAGGACGGDILFHEVCAELGVPTRVLLTLPEGPFIATSVKHGGPDWVKRFNALIKSAPVQILGESEALPPWMRERPGYDVWQRTNIWLLEEAVSTGAPVQTLIALWDGQSGDGPGGTKHLVEMAQQRGLSTNILLTSVVFSDLAVAQKV